MYKRQIHPYVKHMLALSVNTTSDRYGPRQLALVSRRGWMGMGLSGRGACAIWNNAGSVFVCTRSDRFRKGRASQSDKDSSWATDAGCSQVPMTSANGFQPKGYHCHSLQIPRLMFKLSDSVTVR